MSRLLVIIICLFFPVAALACKCVPRGPLCADTPNLNDPRRAIFAGRVVEVTPSWKAEDYYKAFGLLDDDEDPTDEDLDLEEAKAQFLKFWQEVMPEALVGQIKAARTFEEMEQSLEDHKWEPEKRARFEVMERFSKHEEKTFEIYTGVGGGDCGVDFVKGEEWLVFTYKDNASGKWSASVCDRSELLRSAKAELLTLRSLRDGSGLAPYIYGWLIDSTPRGREQDSDSEPIKNRGVTLRTEDGKTLTAPTDEDGSFIFTNLTRSRYWFAASALGWSMADAERSEMVQDLSKAPCAEIRAHVTQEQGGFAGRIVASGSEQLPIKQTVAAIPADPKSGLHPRRGKADRSGRFKITRLEPGEYVLAINVADPPGEVDEEDGPTERTSRYLPAYYPNVPHMDSATRFIAERGRNVEMPVWKLPKQGMTHEYSGRVLWPDETPAKGARLRVYVESTGTHVVTKRTSEEDGSFSFEGMAGLKYKVSAEAQRVPGERFHVEGVTDSQSPDPLELKLEPVFVPHYPD